MKNIKLLSYILIILLVSSIFSGCQQASPANDDQDNKNTRLFEHLMGETEIPLSPERVVAVGYTGHVLVAGINPVGVTDWDLRTHYLKDHLVGAEGIGSFNEVNIEKILDLNPDIIIASDSHQSVYEDLSRIAPTILIPWMEHDVEEHSRIIADALGRTEEANAWWDDFNDLAEQKKEEISQYVAEDETVLIFRIYPDSFSVYGDRNVGHVFYRALGLNPPELIVEEINAKSTGQFNQNTVSLEVMPEYTSDHIIVLVNENETEGRISEVTNTALWQGLPAVQNNKDYFIVRTQWLPYDPISIKGQLTDSLTIFTENK